MVCFAFVAIWPGLVGGSAQLVGLTGMSHLACLLPQYMLGPLGIKEIIKWEKKEKKNVGSFFGRKIHLSLYCFSLFISFCTCTLGPETGHDYLSMAGSMTLSSAYHVAHQPMLESNKSASA